MGPLSEITREFSLEDNIYQDMIYVMDRAPIDEYNYLLDMIPYMIPVETDVSDKEIVRVNGVEIQFPNYHTIIDGKTCTRLLTADLARKIEKNYMCTLVVDLTIINKITGLITTEKRTLGNFPSMVGANRCLLAHKPAEIPFIEQWITMCGEDPSIPGGFFIKAGQKKAILYGQRLGLNNSISIFMSKRKIFETRVTLMHKSKTYLIRVHSGKHTSSVKILCPHLKGKHYPLFLVLYLLSRLATTSFNCDLFVKQISDMGPLKDKEYISSYLETSKFIFIKKFCVINAFGFYEPSYEKINEYIIYKTKRAKYSELKPGLESIGVLLKSEIYPGKNKTVEKIANLLSLVSQHVRCCLNLRPLTNRDSWGEQRLLSPAYYVEQDIIDNIIPCLKSGSKDNDKWRIGKKDVKENIIEPFKVDSINLTRALLSKVDALVDDKIKAFNVRAVAKTGYGGICPAKTAEGVKCGISKHKAICTRVSWNSEYIPNRLKPIFDILLTPTFSLINKTDFFPFQVSLRNTLTNSLLPKRFDFPFFVSSKFLDFVILRKILKTSYEAPFLVIDVEFNGMSDVALWDASVVSGVPLSIDNPILTEIKFYFAIINEFSSMKRMSEYNYLFTYNGNVLLSTENPSDTQIYPYPVYIKSNLVLKVLKTLRRNNTLPIDCCIYKNETDYIIQYFDEPGRLLCPYLLANDDGDLIFDVTNCRELWNDFTGIHDYTNSKKKIDELFKRGALEYVDQKELETTLIAKNIHEFRRFANLRKFLNRFDFEKTESFCYQLKDSSYFKNEDISSVTINGKKFDVVFTQIPKTDKQIVTIDARIDDGSFLKLYGQIAFQIKIFKPTTKRIITLKKNDYQNCQKRDGFILFYFDNDQIVGVPKDSIDVDDSTYNGKKIISIKFKNKTVTKIVSIVNDEYILEENKYQEIKNNGKQWFIEKNETINKNQDLNKDNSTKITTWYEKINKNDLFNNSELFNMVDFGNIKVGESYYFESSNDIIYEDLIDDGIIKYENFDIVKEKIWFDNIENTDALNNPDCDLLISYIRRDQEHLDNIKFNTFEEAKETIELLRREFPLFMKKSNIYRVWRYLLWRFKFTHAPIDPNIAYSAVANLVPAAHCSQGPRYAFQCAMSTQAIGLGNVMHFATFETSIKRLITPEGHLFTTVAEEPLAACTMPTRTNFNLLVFTNRRGPEDAIVLAKSVIQKIRYDMDVSITVREKVHEQIEELIGPPVDYKGLCKKTGGIFSNLSDNGLPYLGSVIKIGDAVVGQKKYDRKTKKMRDISTKALIGQSGEVVQIRVISTEETKKERIVKVKLSQRRFIQVGDKGAAPPSQKGTFSVFVGGVDTECIDLFDFPFLDEGMRDDIKTGKIKIKIVDDNDMPRVIGGPNDGMAIHLIFSPLSFPSRMTMGMNRNLYTGKACLRTQMKQDGTTFRNYKETDIQDILISCGINKFACELLAHSDGEIMYDSTRGTQMMGYVCPQSYQILKHHVFDKEAIRSTGQRDNIAQQPVGGRNAQRLGEMERDAFLSHGASGVQQERMMYASDKYDSVICKKCGNKTSESDILLNVCKICGTSESLCIAEQPRIASVLNQQMNAIGMNITMKFE